MPSGLALDRLYIEHHGWLQGWLQARLNNRADAADLAQDTFLRLLQRRIGELAEPRAYLRTVARGLVIDLWRRRDIERAWLETIAQLPEHQAPSPETGLLIIESLVAIDSLLDELPAAVREAFLLAQLDGMTCPAIAQRLGVSLSTVERYIAKALRHCYRLTFEQP
ncbi:MULTISPECIES: sigma-70 family RNA polymerase sigma factor [Pseudomonas]|uniref:RNA polymerase, sigma-24 subunit, ECF subfamily n=1 Tax=Pseudomonas fulva (strain 12-X) TaxID=743720 RepID=F6AAB8_PSEF1|nr:MULTISPECIES: sigma-70 family RNA polymerase sigma factor [Pseudomonas]AEF24345.1 RNA polymerase, sigma-24 subunit, ECF subfamily [Pseudomonas fulva 12-X]PZW65878.1 RNA polymerase sigma-70 factor (ECF subfamily) [Pseudomonas sp. URMO17WK12:I1]